MPNRSTDLRTTAIRWATRVQATHHVRLSFVRGRQFPFAYQKGDQIIYEEVVDRFIRKLSKHLAPNRNVWKRFKGDFMIPFTSGFHGSYGNVHPHVHINLRKPERVSEAGLCRAVLEVARAEPWIRKSDRCFVEPLKSEVRSIRYGMREGMDTVIV